MDNNNYLTVSILVPVLMKVLAAFSQGILRSIERRPVFNNYNYTAATQKIYFNRSGQR
jgi:hypothetical protein